MASNKKTFVFIILHAIIILGVNMKIEEILENEIVISFEYVGEYDELINHYVLFNDK